jgi:hypothetical protein
MTWITRHVLAISVAILPLFFAVSTSVAQTTDAGGLCWTSGDCRQPLMCEPGWLFGGQCVTARCNFDSDCRNGSVCAGGVCSKSCTRNSNCNAGEVCVPGGNGRICVQRPVSSGGGGGGSGGGTTRGEGAACGTIRMGPIDHPIIKHIGCGSRLQCVLTPGGSGSGICRRPQT